MTTTKAGHTKKSCSCGHTEKYHDDAGCYVGDNNGCPCRKFVPASTVSTTVCCCCKPYDNDSVRLCFLHNSAPDLLEAAKGLMSEYKNPAPDTALIRKYKADLLAAIKKAQGE